MDDEIKRVRNSRTHYEVLGIQRDAQEADIKKAYRRLALKLHPDKNHGEFAEAAFKAVSEAEACLNNSARRKKYDALIRDGGDGRGSALDFSSQSHRDTSCCLPPLTQSNIKTGMLVCRVDTGTDGDEEESGPTVLEAWRQVLTPPCALL